MTSTRPFLTKSCEYFPSPRLTIALPATPRSRSNHVCHSPPPYGCVDSCKNPALDALLTGFSFGHGLRAGKQTESGLVRDTICRGLLAVYTSRHDVYVPLSV